MSERLKIEHDVVNNSEALELLLFLLWFRAAGYASRFTSAKFQIHGKESLTIDEWMSGGLRATPGM